ncbi:ParB-like nuclease domain protein [Microbacterium phage SanaSana]|uniref:ParB-like nuclease domain protein n=1 Tax=Microbacterium phage Stoor TaxID=2829393 RepID=UPI001BEDB04D|nr:ParB-like nuclease domain protein [Microbacterium phage Stoor]QUE26089.1 ParB-like nuclease domain protein [Microbacterium phage Stoor]
MLELEPIRVGRVYHWAIAQVMERRSTDSGLYMSWDEMLDSKREDWHYPEVLASIRFHGFIRPLNADLGRGYLALSDGHHRVAAAIDLGMECVPVFVTSHAVIAGDSGSWREGRPVDDTPGEGRDGFPWSYEDDAEEWLTT